MECCGKGRAALKTQVGVVGHVLQNQMVARGSGVNPGISVPNGNSGSVPSVMPVVQTPDQLTPRGAAFFKLRKRLL